MATSGLVSKVVAIAVGILVVATIMPIALSELANATWGGTNSAVVTLLTVLLPILAVVGIAMYFFKK